VNNSSSINNKLDTSDEMYNSLRSQLHEIKLHSFPSRNINWHEDNWKNIIDHKLDQKWENLRRLCLTNTNNGEENLNISYSSDDYTFNNILKIF